MSTSMTIVKRAALAVVFLSGIGTAAAFQQEADAPGLEWLGEGRGQALAPPASFTSADVAQELQRAEMDRIGSLPVSCHGRRQHGVLYHVRRLAIGDATEAAATALNHTGLAVGYRVGASDTLPTLWAGTRAIDLGAPEGERGEAYGIGASGAIVGWVGSPGPMPGRTAALWYKGARWLLRSPEPENPDPFTVAVALNRHGTIVGNHNTATFDDNRAVIWRRGVPRFLPSLLSSSWVYAINDAGFAVGGSEYPGGIFYQHAVLWRPDGRVVDLGTLGGPDSRAYDINQKGKIVGRSLSADEDAGPLPVLWYRGRWTAFPLPAGLGGAAQAINERDQIVGFQYAGNVNTRRGVTWVGASVYQLDTLLDDESRGIAINDAQDINDRGQILASTVLPSGVNQPLLLTPRPCYRR